MQYCGNTDSVFDVLDQYHKDIVCEQIENPNSFCGKWFINLRVWLELQEHVADHYASIFLNELI